MHKRFTHIINHLLALGKTFDKEELNIEILKSLNRYWQPKVTAISESRDLTTTNMTTLFGKLREHELELERFKEKEKGEKKYIVALKSVAKVAARSSSKKDDFRDDQSAENSDSEEFNLMVKRFSRFIGYKNKADKNSAGNERSSRKQNKSVAPTCFDYGKVGHMKMKCPILKLKSKLEEKSDDNSESSENLEDETNFGLIARPTSSESSEDNKGKEHMWYLHSGCLRHMTGDAKQFSSLSSKTNGHVTYGDNNKVKSLVLVKYKLLPPIILKMFYLLTVLRIIC